MYRKGRKDGAYPNLNGEVIYEGEGELYLDPRKGLWSEEIGD